MTYPKALVQFAAELELGPKSAKNVFCFIADLSTPALSRHYMG